MRRVLPGIALEAGITPSSDLAAAARHPIVVMAIPTQNLRAVCLAMVGKVSPDVVMLCAAKGIEQRTGFLSRRSWISACRRMA